MRKIFKNLVPFWKMILFVLVFLCVQAVCDLSLPSYTSNIIDTGIQNKGVEHVLPEKITEEEYDNLGIFLTNKEKKTLKKIYHLDKKQQIYTLQEKKKSKLADYDEQFAIAMLLDNQMSAMSEKDFKKMVAQQQRQAQEKAKEMAEQQQKQAQENAKSMTKEQKKELAAMQKSAQEDTKTAQEKTAQNAGQQQSAATQNIEDLPVEQLI